MCRSSAKLGGTYCLRERAKNSSYSLKASTSLQEGEWR
jgi:RAB protein geranylgeranyltransferase component A